MTSTFVLLDSDEESRGETFTRNGRRYAVGTEIPGEAVADKSRDDYLSDFLAPTGIWKSGRYGVHFPPGSEETARTQMAGTKPTRVGAHVVIFDPFSTSDQPTIILGQRAEKVDREGQWENFGGTVDAGETIGAAATREAEEEIGLHTKILTRLRSWVHHRDVSDKDKGRGSMAHETFVVALTGSEKEFKVTQQRSKWYHRAVSIDSGLSIRRNTAEHQDARAYKEQDIDQVLEKGGGSYNDAIAAFDFVHYLIEQRDDSRLSQIFSKSQGDLDIP